MNKKVPEITESVETLKALLRKAIKKHEIQRLNTLYLLKSGVAKNRLQVADLLGVHPPECRRLVECLRNCEFLDSKSSP